MSDVNPHYLNHVVELSETADIVASEDIVSSTGIKLLAKGAKVDPRARERLLEFRLMKPLETTVRVIGGVDPARFHTLAEKLVERYPLLSGICSTVPEFNPVASLKALSLSDNLLSMLSIYSGQSPAKMEHAVGVAVLSSALGSSLGAKPADTTALVAAGLLHDIGELYIDPAFLGATAHLTPHQWKQATTHPVVGSQVLATLPGAGPRIASIVMTHHERLDGFGYPQGSAGLSMSMAGQILAVAEMLVDLMESGDQQAERAAVAMRLVPGEFHPRFIDRVTKGARVGELTDQFAGDDIGMAVDIANLEARIGGMSATIAAMRALRASMEAELAKFDVPLRTLMTQAFIRLDRIGIALSSTGLDLASGSDLYQILCKMRRSELTEVGFVMRELENRLVELERHLMIGSEPFSPPDAWWVHDLIEHLRQPMQPGGVAAVAA